MSDCCGRAPVGAPAPGPRVADAECVAFLQWALPRRDLDWAGFRKVRRQVCKRLKRRLIDLGLPDLASYRLRLQDDPDEWQAFDACTHITISRFFRDRDVFDVVRARVLPQIAVRARREQRPARVWSAGCASGEEPYTISVLWNAEIAPAQPGVALSIVATDVDEGMLARARAACFEPTSLRDMPPALIAQAFERRDGLLCLARPHRQAVRFLSQDLRNDAPAAEFDLILCRNLAFTYFAPTLQHRVLARMLRRLTPGGFLVIGSHERLPGSPAGLRPLPGASAIFVRAAHAIPAGDPGH